LLFFARSGAIMKEPMVKWCQENLKNLKSVDIGNGIHYLQEDNPKLIGIELLNWYKSL
jgi:haloalkane dehalogenase